MHEKRNPLFDSNFVPNWIGGHRSGSSRSMLMSSRLSTYCVMEKGDVSTFHWSELCETHVRKCVLSHYKFKSCWYVWAHRRSRGKRGENFSSVSRISLFAAWRSCFVACRSNHTSAEQGKAYCIGTPYMYIRVVLISLLISNKHSAWNLLQMIGKQKR